MSATVADPAAKFRLDGRVGLVTGASSGLGARIAGTLGAAGAEVVLTGRTAERLQQTASALSHPSLVVPGDLRDATFRAALIDAVRDRHGRLDVLVNAGPVSDGSTLSTSSSGLTSRWPASLCRRCTPTRRPDYVPTAVPRAVALVEKA